MTSLFQEPVHRLKIHSLLNFHPWPNKCFMTSFYEHSKPEGGNTKLICILKLLSQAGLLLELHWLCICVIQQALLKLYILEKAPISCIFYTHSFLFSSPANPLDQLLYSHFNSYLSSWIAINVFRKEDVSVISRIQGRTWMDLGLKHTGSGIPASPFICYVILGKLLYLSGPHMVF